ncbi:MAG: IreB family regulatory phosphoprotein [Ruminococcaceae bacterium]|nr:IreB family regulatory phosphoprotein [Oscillospiraceae bacterium]
MAISTMSEDKNRLIDETLKTVFEALEEKGYKPIPQILGYLFTDDLTYITPHKKARDLLKELDRDDIGMRILEVYFAD